MEDTNRNNTEEDAGRTCTRGWPATHTHPLTWTFLRFIHSGTMMPAKLVGALAAGSRTNVIKWG